jgi:hypothetical protein
MEDVDDSSERSRQNSGRSQCLAGPGPVNQGADCRDSNSWVHHVESCVDFIVVKELILGSCHSNITVMDSVVKKKKKKKKKKLLLLYPSCG